MSTYPSIHFSLDADTLKITVGCPTSTYPSVRNKNLHSCWTPWSTRETRGLCARPLVLTPVPVPSQAIHSRTCLNLHHSDIQRTAQKSPCVNTFLRPSQKKNKVCHCLSAWAGHQRTRQQRGTTHGTTETKKGRCVFNVLVTSPACSHSAQSVTRIAGSGTTVYQCCK